MPVHRELEHVALLTVERGHARGVLEEAVVAPAREHRQREDLRERVRLQVRHVGLVGAHVA